MLNKQNVIQNFISLDLELLHCTNSEKYQTCVWSSLKLIKDILKIEKTCISFVKITSILCQVLQEQPVYGLRTWSVVADQIMTEISLKSNIHKARRQARFFKDSRLIYRNSSTDRLFPVWGWEKQISFQTQTCKKINTKCYRWIKPVISMLANGTN